MKTAEEIVSTCTNLYTLPKVYLEVKKVIDTPEATMARPVSSHQHRSRDDHDGLEISE